MDGTLTYWVPESRNRLKSLTLTVCASGEDSGCGIAERRRRRLSRILSEAVAQGARLRYRDLSIIMLASKATLKRDVSHLRRQGMKIAFGGESI
jgi:hypothetical protein